MQLDYGMINDVHFYKQANNHKHNKVYLIL